MALPPNFREGIRPNGTIEGNFVETHYQRCERIELRDGYLAVRMDAGAVDAETRIPLDDLWALLGKPASAPTT